MSETTERLIALRIYSHFYGHLDDKYFEAEKTQEIQDWIHDGQPLEGNGAMDAYLAEWAKYDADDIAANRP